MSSAFVARRRNFLRPDRSVPRTRLPGERARLLFARGPIALLPFPNLPTTSPAASAWTASPAAGTTPPRDPSARRSLCEPPLRTADRFEIARVTLLAAFALNFAPFAMAAFLRNLHQALQRVEQHIIHTLTRRFPPDAYALNVLTHEQQLEPTPKKAFSIKDILNDAFLLAVPKHRRSLERRHKRKYGHPDYILKILKPNNNLQVCIVCGDDHEPGTLCPTCYNKVIEETKLMQDKIQAELKLEPVEKEVVVLYEGEKDDKPAEFWQGKHIIEMEKARPAWFSRNLTEKTTQQPATTKEVKPNQLG